MRESGRGKGGGFTRPCAFSLLLHFLLFLLPNTFSHCFLIFLFNLPTRDKFDDILTFDSYLYPY